MLEMPPPHWTHTKGSSDERISSNSSRRLLVCRTRRSLTAEFVVTAAWKPQQIIHTNAGLRELSGHRSFVNLMCLKQGTSVQQSRTCMQNSRKMNKIISTLVGVSVKLRDNIDRAKKEANAACDYVKPTQICIKRDAESPEATYWWPVIKKNRLWKRQKAQNYLAFKFQQRITSMASCFACGDGEERPDADWP